MENLHYKQMLKRNSTRQAKSLDSGDYLKWKFLKFCSDVDI